MAKIATETPEQRARLSAAERDINLPPAIVGALPQFRPEVTGELSALPSATVGALPATPAIVPDDQPAQLDGQPLQLAGNWRSDLGQGLIKMFGPAADKAGDVLTNVGGPTLGAARRTQMELQGQQRARDEFVGPLVEPDPRHGEYQKKGEIVRPGEEPSAAPTPAPAATEMAPHTAITQAQANAAIDAQVLKQFPRIRPTAISGDRLLADLVQPQRTELPSDGLTDFRTHGEKGDVKIPDTGRVYGVVESISKQYHATGAITDATRGTVTKEVTQELAAYLGADPKRLIDAVMRMEGTGRVPIVSGFGLSETIMAVRNLLYSEVSKLDGLAELAYRERSDANLVNFRQQLEMVAGLQLNFKGIQTEIGRSLGVFRYPVDPRLGPQRDLDLVTLVNEFGGRKDMDEVVEAYLALPVGEKRAQFAQKKTKFKKFTDAMYEAWIHLLLSSPVTHVKNTAGVLFQVFGEIPVGATAATIGTVERAAAKMGGYDYGGVTYGDVGAKSFGMLMSITEAFGLAGRHARFGESPIAGSKLTDASTGLDQGSRVPAFTKEAAEATGMWGQAIDIIGSFLTLKRVPTRALQFEDTLFKVIGQRGKLWELAYRAAREEGLKGDRASDFMAEFMFNPPAEAIKEADDLARYVSLQEELIKTPAAHFKGLARWGAMRWMIPFIKTPYNAAKVSIEHSPFAAVTSRYKEAIASGDRVKIDTARARLALGSTAAIAVGTYCATGQLTGGGPGHTGQREALRRMGWRPYSKLTTNPDGTKEYRSYAWAEPFSTIVGVACDMVEVAQTGMADQEASDKLGVAVAFSFMKNLTSKTYMEGFSSFLAAMQDPDRYGSGITDNFIRSAVPRFVAKIGQIADPQKRMTAWRQQMPREMREYLEKNPGELAELKRRYLDPLVVPAIELGSISLKDTDLSYLVEKVNEIKAQIPGWSDSLPARYDLWGRAKLYDDTVGPQWMSPIYRSLYEPNEVDLELHRLHYPQSSHPEEYNGVPLTAEELEFFQQRAGKLSWEALAGRKGVLKNKTYIKMRKQAIGSGQRWNSDTNQALLKWIKGAIDGARAQALAELSKHPKLGPGFRGAQDEHADFTVKAYEIEQAKMKAVQ